MYNESALFWSYLQVLNYKRLDALLSVFDDLQNARKYFSEDMLKSFGCREEGIRDALMRAEEFDAESYSVELSKHDIQFHYLHDESYPAVLKNNTDAPAFLYTKGDTEVLNQPCVALVGTREMSPYGKRVVGEIVPPLVHAGIVTVSGLALGIDGEVARNTLRTDGKTVAVLGHGFGDIHPASHRTLAEDIVKTGGLLVSEYPLRYNGSSYTFPARNRIIAGLSLATIVVEAPEKSGALYTAEFALEEGKDVYAVASQMFDANYRGCHTLIAKGQAKLLCSVEDVLQDIGIVSSSEPVQSQAFVPSSPDEEMVWKALTTMPQPIDDIMDKSTLSSDRIATALTMMELQGAAKNVGNGQWVRC